MPVRLLYPLALLLGLVGVVGCGKEKTDANATGSYNPDDLVTRQGSRPNTAGLNLVEGSGDLGDADYGQRKTCTFVIHNNTSRNVSLVVSEKSCECTGVDLAPATVPAGGDCRVTLTWLPKVEQGTDQKVRVRATIKAKDGPEEVNLEAQGRIKPTLIVNLPRGRLDFGRIDLGDLKRKNQVFEVYTQDPKHKGFSLTAVTTNPRLFVGTPMRMPADRLASLKAVDGYRMTVQCGEGLPVGQFNETIRLRSSVYPDRDLELPVEGSVATGAVSLQPGSVQLPQRVSVSKGYKCPRLEVSLRGEPGRTLQVEKTDPPFLKAELKPSGKDNVWNLYVEVPAGEANLRGTLSQPQWEDYFTYGFESGAITLKSNHSLAPTIRVPVSGSRFQP